MKNAISKLRTKVSDEITFRLHLLCKKVTQMKRFVIVVVSVIGVALAAGYIYLLITGLYNIVKEDEKSIKSYELKKNTNEYEYRQQSNDGRE